MRVRDIKTKLKYVKAVMNGEVGKLTKDIFRDMYEKGYDSYIKVIKNYMSDIRINSLDGLVNMSDSDIDNKIELFDKENWRQEMLGLSTLHLYRQYKTNIREDDIYDNTWDSVLMFRARSNSLGLGWRNRFSGGGTVCQLCDMNEDETLYHFVVQCGHYERLRHEYGMQETSLPEVLLLKEGCDAYLSKKYIGALWRKRERSLKTIGQI